MNAMPLPAPMAPFSWIDTPWGPSLQCDALVPLATHLFTARGLDLPHADSGDGWAPLARYLGVAPDHLWRMRQVHGVTAHTQDVRPCEGAWPEGDLLATERDDVALVIRTADCVPVLFADERTGAVAAVHAGWRGSAAGAAPRMVEVLASRFGSRPDRRWSEALVLVVLQELLHPRNIVTFRPEPDVSGRDLLVHPLTRVEPASALRRIDVAAGRQP